VIRRLDDVVVGVRDPGQFMVEYLRRRPEALLGFALASDHDTPDEQRLAWDGVGEHGNGAGGVAGLRVAALDPAAVLGIYHAQLGVAVTSSSVRLPNCAIEVVQSEDEDEGLVEVQLRGDSVAARRATLTAGLVFVE
jgi:hypothetical protein